MKSNTESVGTVLQHSDIPIQPEELLQQFYESGEPAPEGVSRKRAHGEGILHGASHTFVYRLKDGKPEILLQRRSYNKDSFPGCLDISSAGHMEFGSDFLQTAQKELAEELGLQVEEAALEELFDQRVFVTEQFHGQPFIDREINKVYALELDAEPSQLTLQPEEVCEALWMRAEDLITALNQNDPQLCMNKEETLKAITILSGKGKIQS